MEYQSKVESKKNRRMKIQKRKKKIIYTHTQTRTKKYWMHMIFQCCRFLFDGFLSLMKSHLSRASTYFRESCSQRIQNMIISVNDCVHFFAFSSLSLGFSRRSDFRMSHSISKPFKWFVSTVGRIDNETILYNNLMNCARILCCLCTFVPYQKRQPSTNFIRWLLCATYVPPFNSIY